MAIKFIQEKEKQQTLVYVLVFLMVFFVLFLWRGVSFDFSTREIPQKEDVVEVNFSALDEIGIEKLREFSIIPPYKESIESREDQEGEEIQESDKKIGRSNPLLPSSMVPITIIEEEETEPELPEEESDEREEPEEDEELDEELNEEEGEVIE